MVDIIDDSDLLELMIADDPGILDLRHPEGLWKKISARLVPSLRKHGLKKFRSFFALGKLGGRRVPANDVQGLFKIWKSEVRSPVKRVYKQIIRQYFSSFLSITIFSKFINFKKISTVVEIGGGSGVFCHTLLELFPNIKKYVLVDIPPVLYLAACNLRRFYSTQLVDYRSTRSLARISFANNKTTREILMICPWQMDRLAVKGELLWNSVAFQRMSREAVIQYAQDLKKIKNFGKTNIGLVFLEGKDHLQDLPPEEVIRLCKEVLGGDFKLIWPTQRRHKGRSYFLWI